MGTSDHQRSLGNYKLVVVSLQKLQKVGQGVMRLAARKSRKDVVTKQVYVSSQVSHECYLYDVCVLAR